MWLESCLAWAMLSTYLCTLILLFPQQNRLRPREVELLLQAVAGSGADQHRGLRRRLRRGAHGPRQEPGGVHKGGEVFQAKQVAAFYFRVVIYVNTVLIG